MPSQSFSLGDRLFSIPPSVAQGHVPLHSLLLCIIESHRCLFYFLAASHSSFSGPLPSSDMPSPIFPCRGARCPYLWTIGSVGIRISTSTSQQVIYRTVFHSSVGLSNVESRPCSRRFRENADYMQWWYSIRCTHHAQQECAHMLCCIIPLSPGTAGSQLGHHRLLGFHRNFLTGLFTSRWSLFAGLFPFTFWTWTRLSSCRWLPFGYSCSWDVTGRVFGVSGELVRAYRGVFDNWSPGYAALASLGLVDEIG